MKPARSHYALHQPQRRAAHPQNQRHHRPHDRERRRAVGGPGVRAVAHPGAAVRGPRPAHGAAGHHRRDDDAHPRGRAGRVRVLEAQRPRRQQQAERRAQQADAVAHAAKICKDHMQLFINFDEEPEPVHQPQVDEKKQKMF